MSCSGLQPWWQVCHNRVLWQLHQGPRGLKDEEGRRRWEAGDQDPLWAHGCKSCNSWNVFGRYHKQLSFCDRPSTTSPSTRTGWFSPLLRRIATSDSMTWPKRQPEMLSGFWRFFLCLFFFLFFSSSIFCQKGRFWSSRCYAAPARCS